MKSKQLMNQGMQSSLDKATTTQHMNLPHIKNKFHKAYHPHLNAKYFSKEIPKPPIHARFSSSGRHIKVNLQIQKVNLYLA